jgi:hypothetical protein
VPVLVRLVAVAVPAVMPWSSIGNQPEAVGEVLAAVVGVYELAGGEFGGRHVVAHADARAVELEAAVGDVAGDLEAQRVVDGVAGFVVGGRVVGVA